MGLAWNELRPDPPVCPGSSRVRDVSGPPLYVLEFGVGPLDCPSGDLEAWLSLPLPLPPLKPPVEPPFSYKPPELGVMPDKDCSADSHDWELKPVELDVSSP